MELGFGIHLFGCSLRGSKFNYASEFFFHKDYFQGKAKFRKTSNHNIGHGTALRSDRVDKGGNYCLDYVSFVQKNRKQCVMKHLHHSNAGQLCTLATLS